MGFVSAGLAACSARPMQVRRLLRNLGWDRKILSKRQRAGTLDIAANGIVEHSHERRWLPPLARNREWQWTAFGRFR